MVDKVPVDDYRFEPETVDRVFAEIPNRTSSVSILFKLFNSTTKLTSFCKL